jgi:PAS domain-containing protein
LAGWIGRRRTRRAGAALPPRRRNYLWFLNREFPLRDHEDMSLSGTGSFRYDGVYRWFLNRVEPFLDDSGKIIRWYGTSTDIDSLKQIEQTLQMREQELLGIIETIPSMLWSTSPSGEPTRLFQRMLEYLGASREGLVSPGWVSFIHPDDREETAKAFWPSKREIHTAQSTVCDVQMESTDRITRWANLCVILAARSFSGMAFQSISMSENEQKTIFATQVSNSQGLPVGNRRRTCRLYRS